MRSLLPRAAVTPAEGGEDVFIHRRNFTKDSETGKTFVLEIDLPECTSAKELELHPYDEGGVLRLSGKYEFAYAWPPEVDGNTKKMKLKFVTKQRKLTVTAPLAKF